jgi:Photosynthesis system II assembly factor YCF48/Putative zinc-finger
MDAALKKLVSERLQSQGAVHHPEPDLLAAYAENSLSRDDRQGLLTHLSACADCRDALYLAMPEFDSQPVLKPSYKSPRLAVRWATLAASVIVVGAVLVADRGILYQHSPRVQTYSAAPEQKVAELKEPVADRPAAAAPAIDAVAKNRPPMKHMTAKPQASMQFDQSGQVHFSSPQAAVSGGNQATADAAAVAARVSPKAMVVSPAASAAKMISQADWGLSPTGQVQRSIDSGKTWQIVPVGETKSFRAITALRDDIWVGGNSGALYHSADSGQSWTKMAPVCADDITHIEFSDPPNGLVNTANGQVWSTSDGGRSWHSK